MVRATFDRAESAELRHRLCPRDVQWRCQRNVILTPDVKNIVNTRGVRESVVAPCVVMAGAQDNQTAMEDEKGGLFSRAFKKIWDKGRFSGDYNQFHQAVLRIMPAVQTPILFCLGQNKNAIRRLLDQRPLQL